MFYHALIAEMRFLTHMTTGRGLFWLTVAEDSVHGWHAPRETQRGRKTCQWEADRKYTVAIHPGPRRPHCLATHFALNSSVVHA